MKRYLNRETIVGQMIHARKVAGLTQAELAKRVGTVQSAISRAEKGNVGTLAFIERCIEACGFVLRFNHVTIEAQDGQSSYSSFTPQSV